MNRLNSLEAVSVKYTGDFIGYGNPNSNNLILGKECGFEPEQPDEMDRIFIDITYNQNAASWKKYCSNPFSSDKIQDWKTVPFAAEEWKKLFCPRFAFKGQLFTTRRIIGHTSTTWYNYQKLLDLHNGVKRGHDNLMDFQDQCFITELNGLPMKKSRPSEEVEQSIKERVRGLFREPYFQSFPLVIAACKGYVNRYGIDLKELFPNARIIVTNQLSIMPRRGYLEEIAEKMKGNEPYCVL